MIFEECGTWKVNESAGFTHSSVQRVEFFESGRKVFSLKDLINLIRVSDTQSIFITK